MDALVFAHGNLKPGSMVDRALAHAGDALIVAADGGAYHCETLGLTPAVIIGDMDSLDADTLARFEARGAAIVRHSMTKNETDLELALLYIVEQADVSQISVIGAMGGRLDQTLANVLLLTRDELAERQIRLVAERQAAWLMLPGEHVFQAAQGDTLSLIPLGGDAHGVVTEHMAYPLRGETLRFGPARGISNVFDAPEALVRFESGRLLAVHTLGKA